MLSERMHAKCCVPERNNSCGFDFYVCIFPTPVWQENPTEYRSFVNTPGNVLPMFVLNDMAPGIACLGLEDTAGFIVHAPERF
jgi:hypothetical protein